MKRFSEQFKKQAKTVQLRAFEHEELRNRIVSYMEYHPLPEAMREEKTERSVAMLLSEPYSFLRFDATVVRAFAGVCAVFVIIVVPMLAERAVPGDILYPVKIQFNEEVRSTLTLSPYAQVEWETQRIERRLAEARLLASEGKLTEEVEAGVVLALKEHSDKAKQGIARLRETDADEAVIAEIAFTSALAVQSEVLENQVTGAKEDGGSGHSVLALADVVAEAHRIAESEGQDTHPSYEKLLAHIEQQSTETFELFESIKASASEEEAGDIERRIADIERKVRQAVTLHDTLATAALEEDVTLSKMATTMALDATSLSLATTTATDTPTDLALTATDTEPALPEEQTEETAVVADASTMSNQEVFALLRQALTDMSKLKSFMTDIDVRTNVTIEELVPVTRTTDERIADVKKDLAEADARTAMLEMRTVEEDRMQKFNDGKRRFGELRKEAEQDLENGMIDSAEKKAEELLKILSDLTATSSAVPETTTSTTSPTTGGSNSSQTDESQS